MIFKDADVSLEIRLPLLISTILSTVFCVAGIQRIDAEFKNHVENCQNKNTTKLLGLLMPMFSPTPFITAMT